MRIAILGGGAWGTALAISSVPEHSVVLWARDAGHAHRMAADRENAKYLAGIALPASIEITADFSLAWKDKDLLVVATPIAGYRDVLSRLTQAGSCTPIVWLCKGFERATAKFPHQIAQEELSNSCLFGALSGPSFARDIASGLPAAVTLAAKDATFAREMAKALNNARLRIYSSDDLVGVEVGGAVKNVIAIAAGISDGLGLGESARAALITRGLAELTRLGVKLGGKMETFLGLAGAGDLMLTCTSNQSRNRRVGLALAQDKRLTDILRDLGHVAEGVFTAQEALHLAEQLAVDTPIIRAVCQVLSAKTTPRGAVEELMRRAPKGEGLGA
jgi:glycerol-3-phosphate dehydrogenase (NAD(P)+)